jgi:hypothetical protein
VPLGATETWKIVNDSKMTHYVHLHEEQWHTIKRDGGTPPPWERGLEDTWRLDPGESVVVEAKFTDYQGVFMIHCHMLDHEDDGMMAQFYVGVPPPNMRLASAVHWTDRSSHGMAGMVMPKPRPPSSGPHRAGPSAVPVASPAPARVAFWPRALTRAGVALAVEVAVLVFLRLLLGYRRRFDPLS